MYECLSRSDVLRFATLLLLALSLSAAVPTIDDIPTLNDGTNCQKLRKQVEKIRNKTVPNLEKRKVNLDEKLRRKNARLDRAMAKWDICFDSTVEKKPENCHKKYKVLERLFFKKVAAGKRNQKKKERIDRIITASVNTAIQDAEVINGGAACE